MSIRKNRLFFTLLLLGFASVLLTAQVQNEDIVPKNNSPLSRYGLGDQLQQYYGAQAGMGGLSAAYQNPFHINVLNPAALAQLQSTAFEVGLYAKYANLSDSRNSDQVWSGNLNYLALGFPLLNPINRTLDRQGTDLSLGMAFSLAPYTLVGYNLSYRDTVPELATQTTNALKGTGGTYRLQWSNAIRYRNIAVGINMGYLFGQITNNGLVSFDSLRSALRSEVSQNKNVRAFTWSGGVQYMLPLVAAVEDKDASAAKKRLVLGAYGNSQLGFTTQQDQLLRRYLPGTIISDTLTTIGQKGKGTLPGEFTLGVAYEYVNHLYVGIEYGQAGWSNYRNDAQNDVLLNTRQLAVGLEYIPDVASYSSYWRRLRYRFGVRYGTDPRQIDGEQARRYGLTLGAGFPIILPRQQTSFVNTALEIGKFGIPNIIDETFVQFTLGFTLNDNTWFFKRKFN